jgi:Flp pilus assembly protein TadG
MRLWQSERGAVLVQTGIGILALMGFSAFSVDYGVLWVGRGQAQNAADAAALAGAQTLAWGDPDDLVRARAVAVSTAQANMVWGEAPDITTGDVTIDACPADTPGPVGTCVTANVYRDQSRGNPLPTYFARLVGVANQGVRATATAKILPGNTSRCMRPWAIPNKWLDFRDGDGGLWDWDDVYERYYENGNNRGQLLPTPPELDAPDPDGFDNAIAGTQVRLKVGSPHDSITAGFFFPIDIPKIDGPSTGGQRYEENIATCNAENGMIAIGGTVTTEPGNMIGPTKQGVERLVALDSGATWSNGEVVGSAYGISPRIVPLPVFNIEDYFANKFSDDPVKAQGRFELTVENIFCFFVEQMDGNDVMGRLMTCPAEFNDTAPTPDDDSAFLFTVILVR